MLLIKHKFMYFCYPMQKNNRNILRSALSVILAVVLLFLAFRGMDWVAFAEGLRKADWMLVLLSMLSGVMAFLVRGVRWREILRPLDSKAGVMRCFGAVNVANLSNMVIPYSGELVRCGIVSKRQKEGGISFDKALGTIVLERAWDMLSIIVIICMILLFKWSDFGSFFTSSIWEPLSRRLNWGIWFLLAALAAAGMAVLLAIVKLKDRNALAGKLYSAIAGVWKGFVICFHMPHKWRFMLYTALIWTFYWLQMVLISDALSFGLGLTDALFLMAVGSIASFVPVPGGFGAYHYLIALAFSTLYGLTWQTGILFATMAHESQAASMVITGVASWFLLQYKHDRAVV